MQTKKIALVTGAAKGIGAACAQALARDGFTIALHYRSDPEAAQALCATMPGSHPFQKDLSDPAQCQDLIKEVKEKFGTIDVLVNNAGATIDQLLVFAKPEDFTKLLSTNLVPVFLLSKFASKLMIRQKSGSIINLSSVVGYSGNAGQSMYAATKSAITGFTKSIAQELAPYGIRCNCVAPGFIKTAMTDSLKPEVQSAILRTIPLARLGQPGEVADAVSFLAQDKSSYITGSTLHVNGGMYTN